MPVVKAISVVMKRLCSTNNGEIEIKSVPRNEAAFKYNAIILLLPILIAHYSSQSRKSLISILLGIVITMIGFTLLTPYWITSFNIFIEDVAFELNHYSVAGHTGAENSLFSLEMFTMSFGKLYIVPFVLTLSGLIATINKRIRSSYIVIIFFAVYLYSVSQLKVQFDRNYLPLVGVSGILLSIGIDQFIQFSKNNLTKHMAFFVISFTLLITTAAMLFTSLEHNLENVYQNTRVEARWHIESNIEKGSNIVIDYYGPPIKTGVYNIFPLNKTIEKNKEWYENKDIEYVVISSSMLDRFLISGVKNYAKNYAYILHNYELIETITPKTHRLNEYISVTQPGPIVYIYKHKDR